MSKLKPLRLPLTHALKMSCSNVLVRPDEVEQEISRATRGAVYTPHLTHYAGSIQEALISLRATEERRS